MAAEILPALIDANLAAGAAILAVLIVRRTVRRAFGARMACALWSAPLAASLATLLPAMPRPAPTPVLAPASPPPLAPAWTAATSLPHALGPDWAALLTALWVTGAIAAIGLLLWRQQRSVAALGLFSRSRAEGQGFYLATGSDGPAVVGFLRPRIVVPADFEARFDAGEQQVILAHEREHLARGHAAINAVAEFLVCLNWFNPLVHVAARCLRVDQELACDAAVVARYPQARQTYGKALLKTQLASVPLPLGCYWPGRSPLLLKERLKMLSQDTPGRLRLLAGAGAATALTLGAGLAAWAAQPPAAQPAAASPAPAAPQPAASDPLAGLGADVSAVVDTGGSPHLLLSETANGVSATRSVGVGDEYKAGWTVAAIGSSSVTLNKGAASRTIAFTGRSQPVSKAAPAPSAPATASVTNAVAGGSDQPDPNAAALTAALAAGDIRQSLALGATAADIVRSQQAQGRMIGVDPDSVSVFASTTGNTVGFFNGVRLAPDGSGGPPPDAPPPGSGIRTINLRQVGDGGPLLIAPAGGGPAQQVPGPSQ